MRINKLCLLLSVASLASCASPISLPVSVRTTQGELFTGSTYGPPFNGEVRLHSERGTTCSGRYTTDQYRTIRAPAVRCSDGRSATFTATLRADLTSARGTANFSNGAQGDVGVGSQAAAVESRDDRASSAAEQSRSTVGSQKRAERVIERKLKDALEFPTSVEFLSNRKDENAGAICGYVFVTHPTGDITIRRLFTSIVFYPESGDPIIAGGLGIQEEGVTFEDFKRFCR